MQTEKLDVVVIGAGQAGLAAGYHLSRAGLSFTILDGAPAVGGSWRNRWDSMRLFTPSGHDGLPGMPYPGGGFAFPSRDEITAYLQDYAARFELPVRLSTPVDGVFREGDHYVITSGAERFEAEQVVLATGCFRCPKVPELASYLDPSIVQLHSADYRNPAQLREGGVLVVGPGNSGADLALDVAPSHRTWLSGEHPGQLPFPMPSRRARALFPAIWFVWTHVLNVGTPIGRRMRPKILAHHEPLIRVRPADLERAGVERVPRTTGVRDGLPVVGDGTVLEVTNVLWCTGFRHDYGFLALDGIEPGAALPSTRGAVDGQPGLYVLGQEFQFAFNSHTVGGVGRDAQHVVRQVVRSSADRRTSTAAASV